MESNAPQPLDELIQQHSESSDEGSSDDSGRRRLPLRKFGILGVIVVAAVAAAWFAASALSAPAPPVEDSIQPKDLPPEPQQAPQAVSGDALLYTMDSIIVNLYQTEARRYLKVSMALAVRDKEVMQGMAAKKLILTDRLIGLLSSKTIDDIDGYDKKQDLKREIRDEVNSMLGIKDAVTQVFFAELIIQ